MKIEKIEYQGETNALILSYNPIEPGVHFYTEDNSSLQVGKQRCPQGKTINPHRHMPIKINMEDTLNEVLYIEKGKVKVTFYDENWQSFDNRILSKGDIILFLKGGHGFEFLEETELIEIKQGPYDPDSIQRMPS